MALLTLYYLSKWRPRPASLSGGVPAGFAADRIFGESERLMAIGLWVAFWILEVGVFTLVVAAGRQVRGRQAWAVALAASLCLLLFPVFRIGSANDFVMRASIPLLLWLAVMVVRTLFAQATGWAAQPTGLAVRVALVVLLLVGTATPLVELRRHGVGNAFASPLWGLKPFDEVYDLWGMPFEGESLGSFRQYVGNPAAPFFTLLSRDAPPIPAPPPSPP
jgi:hypothetical protein